MHTVDLLLILAMVTGSVFLWLLVTGGNRSTTKRLVRLVLMGLALLFALSLFASIPRWVLVIILILVILALIRRGRHRQVVIPRVVREVHHVPMMSSGKDARPGKEMF